MFWFIVLQTQFIKTDVFGISSISIKSLNLMLNTSFFGKNANYQIEIIFKTIF